MVTPGIGRRRGRRGTRAEQLEELRREVARNPGVSPTAVLRAFRRAPDRTIGISDRLGRRLIREIQAGVVSAADVNITQVFNQATGTRPGGNPRQARPGQELIRFLQDIEGVEMRPDSRTGRIPDIMPDTIYAQVRARGEITIIARDGTRTTHRYDYIIEVREQAELFTTANVSDEVENQVVGRASREVLDDSDPPEYEIGPILLETISIQLG